MKRNREQKGSVVRIGDYWCVRYADWRIEDGQRIRKQGLTHKLAVVQTQHARWKNPPKEVEEMQKDFMREVNRGNNAPERCSTIGSFVEHVWLLFVGVAPFIVDTHCLQVLLEARSETALREQDAARLQNPACAGRPR